MGCEMLIEKAWIDFSDEFVGFNLRSAKFTLMFSL